MAAIYWVFSITSVASEIRIPLIPADIKILNFFLLAVKTIRKLPISACYPASSAAPRATAAALATSEATTAASVAAAATATAVEYAAISVPASLEVIAISLLLAGNVPEFLATILPCALATVARAVAAISSAIEGVIEAALRFACDTSKTLNSLR
jgi:hypothetical protein